MNADERAQFGAHSHRRYWTIYRAPRAIRRRSSLEAAMLVLERAAVMCLPPGLVSAGFYLLAHGLLGLRADVAVFVCGGLFFLGVLTMAANMGSSAYSQRHDH